MYDKWILYSHLLQSFNANYMHLLVLDLSLQLLQTIPFKRYILFFIVKEQKKWSRADTIEKKQIG